MTLTIILGAAIGALIGVFIAARQLKHKAQHDAHIIDMVRAGHITPNEAVEWRKTGKPPARLTSGALSPYD